MMQGLLFDKSLTGAATARLREYEPPEGYWLAFSGGKDSTVVLDLAKQSGVKFDAHYSLTTCDPPELVHFIQRQHPEVVIERPPKTMWQLVRKNGLPIRGGKRGGRWCCRLLKERGGLNRHVLTGIRWEESPKRRETWGVVTLTNRGGRRILINPIIDWTAGDVWGYIRGRGLPYCSLYDEGFRRLGCVLCPQSRAVARDTERWPRIVAAWKRAAFGYWGARHAREPSWVFKTPAMFWEWWIARDAPVPKAGGCELFGTGGNE